ncbi:MAG: hypothetical protein IKI26_08715 [Prevotella sp.]|nr:hypothetical protein [Prevotella sp.]
MKLKEVIFWLEMDTAPCEFDTFPVIVTLVTVAGREFIWLSVLTSLTPSAAAPSTTTLVAEFSVAKVPISALLLE